MIHSRFRSVLIAALAALGLAAPLDGAVEPIPPGDPAESFPLVVGGEAVPIVVLGGSAEVIRIAAGDLAEDIGAVTGVTPRVVSEVPAGSPHVVVGVDPRLGDRWEAFRLTAEPGRVIVAGSDPRGVAFGIYELSRRIGVSPWNWWADVPVARRDELRLSIGETELDEPAVRYRGIFLNDEDWGLEPWARETFEPEAGTIGPKTYARIFELMLRLRANTIWPAMHECTTPFHQVEGNNEVADDYAIVLGSSHAEPMLRNNVGEWKAPKDHYNYLTHRSEVLDYWEERVKERSEGQSLFTLGMRGIHDSSIVGPKTREERVETLEQIFADQRDLLREHLNEDLSQIGQVFCPYKEVLADYRAGLEVPEDATIVWPDDNFGYVRQFPSAAERERKGGSGVYYHLSYLGNPLSWLWFDSLPPALVWAEMNKAWEQGARDLWIANVGDLKGNEQSTEWFLDLAWNADEYGPESGVAFLERMAARDFGTQHGTTVAELWRRHQALAFARKPEHLQWHLSLTDYRPSEMNVAEILARLEDYRGLADEARALVDSLPEEARDAAFQLILYPIACADAANRRYFQLELARRGRPEADLDDARAADREIGELTKRFNEELADGKWTGIMSAHGLTHRDWVRFQPTPFAQQLKDLKVAEAEDAVSPVLVAPEPPAGLEGPGFFEHEGVVAIHAGHFTGSDEDDGMSWRSVPGLGRTGSAIVVRPTTGSGQPTVSYRFHLSTGGAAKLHLRLLPTHPIDGGRESQVAFSIDEQPFRTVGIRDFDPKSIEWKERVMANASSVTADLEGELSPGWHTLRLQAVDPGVAVDKIVLDLGGRQASYAGPPETRIGP